MLFSHTSKRGNLLTSIYSFVFLCLPASELLTINYQLLTVLILFCSRHTAHSTRRFVSLNSFSYLLPMTRDLPPVLLSLFSTPAALSLRVFARRLRRSNLLASIHSFVFDFSCSRLKAHGSRRFCLQPTSSPAHQLILFFLLKANGSWRL